MHKRVTTAIGLAQVSRYVLGASELTTIGSAEVTFNSMEKISRVYYLSGTAKKPLEEVTVDEIRDESDPDTSDEPTKFAVKGFTDDSVTIITNRLSETSHALYADGFTTAPTLSGVLAPNFPESFHDILVEGVLMDEYKRMEKTDLADRSKAEFEQRLSDLKMWAAKSAYLEIQQGRAATRRRWWDR